MHDKDLTLTVITNYLKQFNSVRPAEHALVHPQLRFLLMEYRFNQAMSFRIEQILKTSVFFPAKIMRDLDCRPARIQPTVKTIHAEQEHRLDPDLEIEATAD